MMLMGQKFAIGQFVTIVASKAEGKVAGFMIRHEQHGAAVRRIAQYLVLLGGDPIWIDEDRLVAAVEHLFTSEYGTCARCGLSKREAVGTATVPAKSCRLPQDASPRIPERLPHRREGRR